VQSFTQITTSITSTVGVFYKLDGLPTAHRRRKMFRPGEMRGVEGTEWPETVIRQGVGSPLPTGVEMNFSGKK